MLHDLYDQYALVELKILDEGNGIGDIKYFTSVDNEVSFHIKNYFRYLSGCCSEWGDYGCCASIAFYD